MQSKVKLVNTNQVWNAKRRYKVNETVAFNGIDYQNATGINSEPGTTFDWILVKDLQVVPIFITVTKSELDVLVTNSNLQVGATYKITGVHTALYGGTDILLQALTPNKLSVEGSGIFYNPKYNQAVSEYGIWSNRGTWLATLVTGKFLGNEAVTANNGAIGTLFTNLDANLFISDGGDWSTAVSITGNVSGATATITSVVEKSYAIDDIVFWGGYAWKNLMGFVGASVNSLVMDFEWEKLPYDLVNYNLVSDAISYDYENDTIFRRADTSGNEVISTKSNNDYWIDNGFEGLAINVFQFGNSYSYFDNLGVGMNIVENSYCDNINFSGSYFNYNTLSGNSYFYSNTLSSNSYFYSNTLSSGSSFTSNTLSSGSSFYSNKFENSQFSNLNFTNKTIKNLTVENSIVDGVDFSTATIIFATFARTIFTTPNGTLKIRYYNDAGVLVITDIDA